jgi:DNA modification methylase
MGSAGKDIDSVVMHKEKIQANLKVEYLSLDAILPYIRNARTHSPEQISSIASSIREFGWTNPVLIDDDLNIIAGHGRLLAARKLGMQEVPCIKLSGLTKAQKKALVIADNKLALNAGWDESLLSLEIEDLKLEDFDISLLGFADDELKELLALNNGTKEGLTDEDEAPEAPVDPISKLGDLWVLGSHRLLCGDSTKREDVERLMDGQKADIVATDPPYGMDYEGGRGSKKFGRIKGDAEAGSTLRTLLDGAFASAKYASKGGAPWYVWFTWRTYSEFEQALCAVDKPPKTCIVWNKGHFGLSHGHYRPQHEFAFYVDGGVWYGDRAQSDVWTISRDNHTDYVHPTQKPVAVFSKALENSSKAGDIALDLFGGSGSILIACEKNSRSARLMELDPKYCDVICQRYIQFCGKSVIRESDGASFADLQKSTKETGLVAV